MNWISAQWFCHLHASGLCLGLGSELIGYWPRRVLLSFTTFQKTVWRIKGDSVSSPWFSSGPFLWTIERKYNIISEKTKSNDWLAGGSAPKDRQEYLLRMSNSDCVLNPWSFNWDLTWSQDLMKLRFLTSHHRKNSLRDKATGMRRVYLERNTPQSVDSLRRQKKHEGIGLSTFIGMGNCIG